MFIQNKNLNIETIKLNDNETLIQLFYIFFKKYIYKIIKNENGSQFFFIKNEYLLFITSYLNKNFFLSFNILNNITVVDCIFKKNRYEIYYLFLNLKQSLRFFLVLSLEGSFINPFKSSINSLCTIYKSALQLEREIQDMYGIYFYNHKDLRRILTDYGFRGFPLRKDFPLTGFFEIKYDELNHIIVINELRLVQNLRVFDFINPQN